MWWNVAGVPDIHSPLPGSPASVSALFPILSGDLSCPYLRLESSTTRPRTVSVASCILQASWTQVPVAGLLGGRRRECSGVSHSLGLRGL